MAIKNKPNNGSSTDQCASTPTSKEARKRELVSTFLGALVAILFVVILSFMMPTNVRGSMIAIIGVFLVTALPLRIIYIYYPNRAVLVRCKERISEIYSSLAIHQKLYVNSCIVTSSGLLLIFAGGKPLAAVYLALMLTFYAYVVVYDVLRWYKAIYNNLIGKAVIGLAFTAASNFAYSVAGQQIADTIHVAPTNFSRTALFIAIATIPFIMIVIAGIVATVTMVMPLLSVLPLMLGGTMRRAIEWLVAGTIQKSTVRHMFITCVFQMVFYGVMAGLAYKSGRENVSWYDKKISHATSWLIYNFDMYNGQECNLKEGSKLAPLGDAKFLIAHKSTEGAIVFDSPVKCDDLPAQPAIKE